MTPWGCSRRASSSKSKTGSRAGSTPFASKRSEWYVPAVTREQVVELYLGTIADRARREAGRERLMWIAERTVGPNVLISGDDRGLLSILLARPGLSISAVAGEEARRLLDEQDEKVKSRVSFVETFPAAPADALIVLWPL